MVIKIKKAQAWSVDIALAVVIFLVAFIIFYTTLGPKSDTKVKGLQKEGAVVIKQLVSGESSIRIVENNKIDINKLKELSYEELKRELRAEGDFCIYIEDEKGNVVQIASGVYGRGSPSIEVSGNVCSKDPLT